MRMLASVLCCAQALISACSAHTDANSGVLSGTDNSAVFNVDANLTTNAPALPDHNYALREGDTYGYIAGLSDEDRKKGKSAGDVMLYKYAGFTHGTYRLVLLLANGTTFGTAECSAPCVAIKESFIDGDVRRIGFNENSVIGAAFQDAIRGKLVRFHSEQMPAHQHAPSSAYQNNIVETDENGLPLRPPVRYENNIVVENDENGG